MSIHFGQQYCLAAVLQLENHCIALPGEVSGAAGSCSKKHKQTDKLVLGTERCTLVASVKSVLVMKSCL
jgi:hypothetical protein